MVVKNKTEQEQFWEQDFGDQYISRNNSKKQIASNIAFFSDVLRNTNNINTVMEFGANIGLNLRAINQLLPNAQLHAVEINKKAVKDLLLWLKENKPIEGVVYHESILNYEVKERFDLVLVKTVLIHINPDKINDAYQKIYDATSKYIIIAEYYNPIPVAVRYRDHEDKLFKRDFAGEMMKIYPDLVLRDYGFLYHLDKNFPQDDINWFLLERVG